MTPPGTIKMRRSSADNWDSHLTVSSPASLLCTIALTTACLGAIGGRGGTESFGSVLSRVTCLGEESAILECSVLYTVECLSEEIATVVCQGNIR